MIKENFLHLIHKLGIGIFIRRFYKFPKIIKSIEPENYLSIVSIVKNEANYILEWIEYHLYVGVDHFYIYDNGSTDSIKEILEPYIRKGIVTYHFLPGKFMQEPSYNDAIARYKYQSRWMAFIDADEFIALTKNNIHKGVKTILRQYEAYPALGVNWVCFDANGHESIPLSGFVIEKYTRVHKDSDQIINRHIKSIINPLCVRNLLNYHFAFYKNNKKAVDENFIPIKGPFTKHHTATKIRINHYWSKSKEEFLVKINKRGYSDETKRECHDSDWNYEEWKLDNSMQGVADVLRKIIPETYANFEYEKL